MLRTHTCGEMREAHVGNTVTLCGWVDGYRDFGGLLFVDLRDRYGLTQIVFHPSCPDMHAVARTLRAEFVVRVTGEVVPRGEGMENPRLATGDIEIRAAELSVLNSSPTPPFEPGAPELPNEDLRLRHRYLDLRREPLQQAMELRHRLCEVTRNYFNDLNFWEIETPILGKSTPEGARDYLVPSRVHPGSFYALPQSPQIYKQLLMVAGMDRYYQIARCFRDEDLRADRQPEFTQIDMEMSFVERDDVLETIDGLVGAFSRELRGKEINLPLPRYSYAEVIERFGSDKPDLRYGMELKDIGEIASASEFGVFKGTIENGGRVRGICVEKAAEKYSRKAIDGLTDFVKEYGAKGLAFFKVAASGLESSIAKFFTEEQQSEIIRIFDAKPGDLLLFVADKESVTSAALAALRAKLAKDLELFDPNELSALWVLDFPLLHWDEDEQRWDAEHHPFCQPIPEDVGMFESDPGSVRAASYDLVVNGYEGASGSIRIHDPQVQQTVFDLLNISVEDAETRFGFLLEGLRNGAPPHGGIALGLDRWVMVFGGLDNIRDVIAFPKTQRAADRLSGAPSPVDAHQLEELAIRCVDPAQ